jgi:pimeloyl-ACP methyl ester carboxylesterase
MEHRGSYYHENVRFTFGHEDLTGILTLPSSEGPYPAIVLLHGSDRPEAEDPYYKEHAENLVQSRYAVLRYDGPGKGGRSSEQVGFETLDYRAQEALTSVEFLQSHPDIKPTAVGLWGFSQGGWICQMAASGSDSVAFISPVSGPGVSPGEQEVYRVEAETKSAGYEDIPVAKAVLMRRLMLDLVLLEPMYQTINLSEAQRLGVGPWTAIVEHIYGEALFTPSQELEKVIEVLHAVRSEPWTEFLYVERILTLLESIAPEVWLAAKAQMRAVMVVNPADYLTKVHCPVLAIFGSERIPPYLWNEAQPSTNNI